ncbi:hypothetical protein WJ969_05925 [Achromobacter xylosoxidans]
MNPRDYQSALRRELDAHTDAALRVLAGLFPRLPEKRARSSSASSPTRTARARFPSSSAWTGPTCTC